MANYDDSMRTKNGKTPLRDANAPKGAMYTDNDTEKLAKEPEEILPVFVGRGNWYHGGYHMVAAVASVPTLALPGAMAGLGWGGGIVALFAGGAVTFYTSMLIASLHDYGGKRHIRYRDLATAILGNFGWWSVLFCQMAVCVGSTIANLIVGGQALKAVCSLNSSGGTCPIRLTEFIIMFTAVNLFLAQLPHFHAIRWVNTVATFATITFSIIAVSLSLYSGFHNGPGDYSIAGNTQTKIFTVFNSLGIISFAYGNTVIPEIQATVREPVKPTMYKAIGMGFTVIISAYICVAFTGYWAFGNQAASVVLSNLTYPGWTVTLAWCAAAVQLTGTTMVYLQPIFEGLDLKFGNMRAPLWSMRNFAPRLVLRTTLICICSLIACMFPFFGDVMGVIGAIGYTPMDFILPQLLWLYAYKPRGVKVVASLTIAVVYFFVMMVALIGGVRLIVTDSVNYSLFANV